MKFYLRSVNDSNVSYHGWLACLDFLLTYLYEKALHHQQSDAPCSIELPYEDHWYRLRKEAIVEQNLVVHHNLLALSTNYIHWWRQIFGNLTGKTWSRVLWSTISNAFCKYKIVPQPKLPSSWVHIILSVRLIRIWVTGYFCRKANFHKYVILLMRRKLDSLLYINFSMIYSKLDKSDIGL